MESGNDQLVGVVLRYHNVHFIRNTIFPTLGNSELFASSFWMSFSTI